MLLRHGAVLCGIMIVLGIAALSPAQETRKKSGQTEPKPEASSDSAKSDSSTAKTDSDSSQDKDKDKGKSKSKKKKGGLEKATFGGGCFWCMEAVFERIPGIKSVISGYAGGNVPNPTYEMVHSGLTGHAEVIQIEFDPDQISYEKLLKAFFSAHDPTTPNQQGVDVGTQYRSVIFYHNDEQKEAALKMYKELTAKRVFRAPIVTQLEPMSENQFYPAEAYHQNYFRNNPYTEYSGFHIVPKLKKLKLDRARIQAR